MSTSNPIYKYFVKTGDVAKCLLCKSNISCKQSSTKGLWTHLKTHHKEEHQKLKPDSSKKVATAANKVTLLLMNQNIIRKEF
jgi:hypothetical protein